MTSDEPLYVWVWLPGAADPVVAGVLTPQGEDLWFTYGRSYLDRPDAVPLQPHVADRPGLPLQPGPQRPPLPPAHGAIRDAAPDSWGMRVIARLLNGTGDGVDELPLRTHLSASGSNRIGNLDFQASPTTHTPRTADADLEELLDAAERIEQGAPLTPAHRTALLSGTAVGGARPKALVTDTDGTQMIAKFSVSTDAFPWVQAEAVGMELARRCGVTAAATRLVHLAGRDVLLVDRFDRPGAGREQQLSALTLLGLHELAARHATYVDLAHLVRLHFTDPADTLRQLYTRVVVNVLVGNTDDHARNHAAFVRGHMLKLTPAYDIAPQPRTGGETGQAMAYGPDGARAARLATLARYGAPYGLTDQEARQVVDRCRTVVAEQYDDVCATVGVTDAAAELLRGGAILNPSVDYPHE